LDGDGSLLMNLGTLVTIGQAAPTNLVHFVYENGVYEVTGGQPIPGAGLVDFAGMAKGAGYRAAYTFDNAKDFEEAAGRILFEDGPTLIDLKLKTSQDWEEYPERDFNEALQDLKENLSA
jgi:phosphonopyruvate decarboxylase